MLRLALLTSVVGQAYGAAHGGDATVKVFIFTDAECKTMMPPPDADSSNPQVDKTADCSEANAVAGGMPAGITTGACLAYTPTDYTGPQLYIKARCSMTDKDECPVGRADYSEAATGTCPSGFYEDGQGYPAESTWPKAPEAPATQAPATQAPATQAPATQAPATQAPTTAAPTTAAPAGNSTGNSSRVLFEEFNLPIVRKLAAHGAWPTCACKADPNSGNNTNGTVETQTVTTEIVMTMDLDISGMDATQKTATGNAIAYGIHASACKGVSDMWVTLARCMMGVSKTPGVTFGMAMGIDGALVGDTQPGCTSATDCYGDAARRLAATTLTNKADFSITAKSTDAAKVISTAKASLDTAAADLKDPVKLLAEVQTAMARPAMAATLGNLTSLIADAVKEAKITSVTAVDTGSTAPASNAYTAAVSGVFMVVVGALLM